MWTSSVQIDNRAGCLEVLSFAVLKTQTNSCTSFLVCPNQTMFILATSASPPTVQSGAQWELGSLPQLFRAFVIVPAHSKYARL